VAANVGNAGDDEGYKTNVRKAGDAAQLAGVDPEELQLALGEDEMGGLRSAVTAADCGWDGSCSHSNPSGQRTPLKAKRVKRDLGRAVAGRETVPLSSRSSCLSLCGFRGAQMTI
jgi:hypothetical protein